MAAEPACNGRDLIGRHMPFGNFETKKGVDYVSREEAEASICNRLKLDSRMK